MARIDQLIVVWQVNQETQPPALVPDSALPSLGDVLRAQGLYAMSKFLRQSGLDAILNSTGQSYLT